jgi:hypothetical protein
MCDAGERATGGGGAVWNGNIADFDLVGSEPIIAGDDSDDPGIPIGWRVQYVNRDVNNSGTGNIDMRPWVVCAAP